MRWWAHYGGTFDALVLLRWFLDNGWKIEGGRAGAMGSLWSLDLVKGRERIELRDSARIFVDSLAELGKAFGLAKLDKDRGNLQAISTEELLEYCYRDCDITLLAVTQFDSFLRREGGSLADTIASCGSRIVRSRCVPPDAWGWDMDPDECGARAYYGGRVERFRETSAGGSCFDVNSMYPWAMTTSLPTRYVGTGKGVLPTAEHVIVRATVHVPRGTYAGPLPHRPKQGALKGRLVFPTGTFDGTWTIDELRTTERLVPGFWFRVKRWWQWEGEPWLADLIRRWYERRKNAATSAEKYMLKLLLNCISGKLIERAEYESITTVFEFVEQAERDGIGVVLYPTQHGIFYGLRETKVGNMRHAAAAAFVLSRSRCKLYEGIHDFARVGRIDYCDTDSLYGIGLPRQVDPKELGAWKHEFDYQRGEFLASKLYAVESDGQLLVKCKGWPKSEKLPDGTERKFSQAELWEKIRSGQEMTGERTVLFKSQVLKGEISFTRDPSRRKRHSNVDKRNHLSKTESRPWSIDELPGLK